mmetsp:Transcript_29995/g.52716  ORF Transcript_29995/g.52716 Transcript_29995/m.52716 type:complete len:249 (-) Transcript_29995:267-1013(-)
MQLSLDELRHHAEGAGARERLHACDATLFHRSSIRSKEQRLSHLLQPCWTVDRGVLLEERARRVLLKYRLFCLQHHRQHIRLSLCSAVGPNAEVDLLCSFILLEGQCGAKNGISRRLCNISKQTAFWMRITYIATCLAQRTSSSYGRASRQCTFGLQLLSRCLFALRLLSFALFGWLRLLNFCLLWLCLLGGLCLLRGLCLLSFCLICLRLLCLRLLRRWRSCSHCLVNSFHHVLKVCIIQASQRNPA